MLNTAIPTLHLGPDSGGDATNEHDVPPTEIEQIDFESYYLEEEECVLPEYEEKPQIILDSVRSLKRGECRILSPR